MYFAHTNLLGTVRVKSDESGAVARTCDYGPYGDNESCSPADTYGSEVRYAGYERDQETGLDHMWFRYYNPRLGRFMSADPLSGSIGDPQSLNKVAYVTGNPTNATDPLGLFGCGGGNSDACPRRYHYSYNTLSLLYDTTHPIGWSPYFGPLPGAPDGGFGVILHFAAYASNGLMGGVSATSSESGRRARKPCKPGKQEMSTSERVRLGASGFLNLVSSGAKVRGASAALLLRILPVALYEGLTVPATAVTGALQIGAALSGDRDLSTMADYMTAGTGISPFFTLVATGGDPKKTAVAANIESLATFGLSGAMSADGVQFLDFAGAVNDTTDIVSPMEESECR
jgi:RHS repeat-associated protein